MPTSRWFPLRFHVLHALLRITARTGNYVPLAPFLLEILESVEFKRANPKNASLKPLDLEYAIKAPASYPKTKIYQETLAEELVFLLGEFHAVMSTNIAFPEMTIPVVFMLKRYLKKGGASGKVNNQLKTLVEKIEVTRQWVEKKRRSVTFAPNDRADVEAFLEGVPVTETPIGAWMRLQKKVRDQKRKEIEMVSSPLSIGSSKNFVIDDTSAMCRLSVRKTSELPSLAIPRRMRVKKTAEMRIWKMTSDLFRIFALPFCDVVSPARISCLVPIPRGSSLYSGLRDGYNVTRTKI